jgi:hypothetical protein
MKIYLAGPMRGKYNLNFPAFDYATAKLRAEGHIVFNPAERDREKHGPEIENNPTGDETLCAKFGLDIRSALADDLEWICKHGDAVALLPGWEQSRGATCERATAIALDITVMTLGKDYVNNGKGNEVGSIKPVE